MNELRPEDLDRVLSRNQEILPSSGFVASVMEAVHREAAAPPPIPFPWKLALPLVPAVGAIVWLIVMALAHPAPTVVSVSLSPLWTHTIGWVALGLGSALASFKLAMRFCS